jgi:hypothetical protein
MKLRKFARRGGIIVIGTLVSVVDLLVSFAQIARPRDGALPTTISQSPSRDEVAVGKEVINLYGGYRLRQSPQDTASPVPGQPLKFLGRYVVKELSPVDSNERKEQWACLADGDPRMIRNARPLGWIPVKYLSTGLALRDPVTTIYKKAFLRPHVADLARWQFDGAFVSKQAPETQAPVVRQVRFYKFFYIFAETGDNPERDWVFLASEYQLSGSDTDQRIVGWVPRKMIEPWLTREALQWSTARERRLSPGIIWRDPESALNAGPWGTGDETAILFKERFLDGKPFDLPPEVPRYPINNWPEQYKREQFLDRLKMYPGWDLLYVVVAGQYVDEKGHPIANAEEIARLQTALQHLAEQHSNFEIVFVIDETESMQPWFGRVADAVSNIVQNLQKYQSINLKIGVTFYNDVALNRQPITCHPLTNDIDKIITNIRNHKTARGGDPEESVFLGIKTAIEKSGFRPRSTKLLVLLGDDADKSSGISEKDIVELLFSYPVPIAFTAIQVYPEQQLANRPVAQKFRHQMETIAELYNRRAPDNVLLRATVLSSYEENIVQRRIADYVTTLATNQSIFRGDLQKLQYGDFGAVVGQGMEAILRELGARDAELLKRLRSTKGVQLVHGGYVWAPDLTMTKDAPVEYVLFLTQREVEEIRDSVLLYLHQIGLGQPNDELWRVRNIALGDPQTLRRAADIRRIALKGTGKLLLDKFLEGNPDSEDVFELRLRYLKLDDLLNGVTRDYQRGERQEGGVTIPFWKIGNPQPVQRAFKSLTGETRFYWVRVRDECP